MQNKNPQGNFDPIPDSDQELEKYGVWVKAEPQDVVEEPETEHQLLMAEGESPIEPLEELSDEIEELEEMQSFDEAGTETFEDLAPLDEEDATMMDLDSETRESTDLSDLGLDEPKSQVEAEQSFEEIGMELDLDDDLSADDASDDDLAFDFDSLDEADSGMDLALDTEDSDNSGDLLPEIDMEHITMEDDSPIPSFDDLGALEADLASSPTADNSVPNDLLQKIALELSSIKEELVSLRSQLGELKREPFQAETDEEETEEESAKGGFFDDEDDDTIALTGDELDNILNTADFTVEPPEDLTIPESLDEAEAFGLPAMPDQTEAGNADWSVEEQDLLPEDGSYLSAESSGSIETEEALEPGIEAIDGDEALDLDFGTDEELSPLEIIPEIHAVTESPDDTSYLDDEVTEVSDGFELDASPLEEVPLVEPDLTELDLGIEIDDALAAESVEDLPFMESADEDEAEAFMAASENDQEATEDDNFDSLLDLEEADDDLILSIDGDEQEPLLEGADFAGSVEEIEEVEPLGMDPFKDEVVSELELHKEGTLRGDSSWTQEPEASPQSAQTEEFEELESLVDEEGFEEVSDEETKDLGAMDLEDTGILGTQEVEDLGGEDLEVLDDEVLEGLGNADDAGALDDLAEMEELQAEAPVAAPVLNRAEKPEEHDSPEAGEREANPDKLKQDVKSVLLYLDQLLASLPEEKIEEFASSEYYDTYKKLFEDLGLL